MHKEYCGKGPTKAKAYHNDDLIVVLLRGGFTRAEATLHEGGRGGFVSQQRAEFQDVMGDRFKRVVEEETRRWVTALMSGSHQQPDLICEVFVLEPSDVLAECTGDERGPVIEG